MEPLERQLDQMMRSRGLRPRRELGHHSAPGGQGPSRQELYFTGYPCGRLYGWDQYFEGVIQLHLGWSRCYIRASLEIFLDHGERDGYIPRTLPRIWWGEFHAQPFLAQQALLLLRAGDDMAWLFPERYFRLKRYLMHWLFDMDRRGAGLSVWDHAGHSGMDNHYERGGTFHDRRCEGVDLNSYLVRECEALALLAEHFGVASDAAQARQ